jgi:mannose-6-phosphate isomerase-like protein (cupin superfamily)
MKFSKSKAFKSGWDGLDFWAYSSKDDFANTSATYFETTKAHGKIKTTVSDRIYYVIEGQGVFEIDGSQEKVGPTDVIIVPKNTEYDYWATDGTTLKLFMVHVPAFDPAGEVLLDKTKRQDL